MKTRIIFKSIFLLVLFFLLIGLTIIIFSDNNIYSRNYPKLEDYIITYNEECNNGKELLYEDDNNKYYISCDITNVHLKWDFGNIDSLNTALKNKKVTIDSLINHGLKVKKVEK